MLYYYFFSTTILEQSANFVVVINTSILNKFRIPEVLELTVKQRNAYREKWDTDKKVTMDKFYHHYPQFKTYPLPDKEFNWLWYYAIQQKADDDSEKQSQELEHKLQQRSKAIQLVAQFIPMLYTQLQLNEIAQSNLGS